MSYDRPMKSEGLVLIWNKLTGRSSSSIREKIGHGVVAEDPRITVAIAEVITTQVLDLNDQRQNLRQRVSDVLFYAYNCGAYELNSLDGHPIFGDERAKKAARERLSLIRPEELDLKLFDELAVLAVEKQKTKKVQWILTDLERVNENVANEGESARIGVNPGKIIDSPPSAIQQEGGNSQVPVCLPDDLTMEEWLKPFFIDRTARDAALNVFSRLVTNQSIKHIVAGKCHSVFYHKNPTAGGANYELKGPMDVCIYFNIKCGNIVPVNAGFRGNQRKNSGQKSSER